MHTASANSIMSGDRLRQAPSSPSGGINREQFAQRFLRVANQLETLQLIVPHAPPQSFGPRAPPSTVLSGVHSRERVQEVLRLNARFRPCEAVARSASANLRATVRTLPQYPHEGSVRPPKHRGARPANASPRTVKEAGFSAPLVAKPADLYAAVGGKARALPSTELSRMKRALKKRSYALANLQHTGSGSTVGVSAVASVEAPSLPAVVEQNDSEKSDDHEDTTASLSSPMPSTSNGKHALIAELVRLTEFSTAHIFQLSRRFKATAGAAKCAISFEEFREVLGEGMTTLLSPTSSARPDGVTGMQNHADNNQEVKEEGQEQVEVTTVLRPAPPDLVSIGATIAGSETFLQRLFHAFDVDGNGQIDVREFIVGLNSLVRGTPEEKVAAIFEIYRSDVHQASSPGDSASEINVSSQHQLKAPIADLLGLFQSDRQRCQELTRCVDDYFVRVQLHDEAAMTTDEFVAASLAEPRLLRHVSRSVASERRRAAEDPKTRELLQRFVTYAKLRWQTLADIQRRMKWPKTTTKGVLSIGDVQRIIMEALQQQSVEEQQQHTQTLGGEEPSELPLEELTHCLVVAYRAAAKEALSPPSHDKRNFGAGVGTAEHEEAITTMTNSDLAKDLAGILQTSSLAASVPDSAAHQARFFFEHFDADGDGHMTRHELAAGLGARVGAQVLDVARRLEDEDGDQDGELTPEEYLRAAYKSPLIFASLYTCL